MARRIIFTLLGVLTTTLSAAETCGKDKSGQAISCDGICCPSSGTWSCAPLDAQCCYEANRVGQGFYCAAGGVCFDNQNCMPSDSFSTFPATPGTSENPTQVTWSAMQTVYDGPIPTTARGDGGKGRGGGQGVTGTGPTITGDGPVSTGTKTGQAQGTESSKPNGVVGASVVLGGMWVAVAGAMSVACFGVILL